jgi:dynein heavy chain
MPHFAGQKGPEIARSLLEIEATFEKNLSQLRAVKKTILDVKATSCVLYNYHFVYLYAYNY